MTLVILSFLTLLVLQKYLIFVRSKAVYAPSTGGVRLRSPTTFGGLVEPKVVGDTKVVTFGGKAIMGF
jgi:hypothetical protein